MKSLKTVSQRRTSKYIRAVRVGERRIPKKVVPGKKRYTGICSICENAPTCIYKRGVENPVLNCAEFKAKAPKAIIYSAQSASIQMNNKENEYTSSSGDTEYKGLCVNCAHRHTCIYPKPEGGVWSCAEYE